MKYGIRAFSFQQDIPRNVTRIYDDNVKGERMSMKQGPFSRDRQLHSRLQNSEAYCRVHDSPPSIPLLSHIK
jgi:hypothetical protein